MSRYFNDQLTVHKKKKKLKTNYTDLKYNCKTFRNSSLLTWQFFFYQSTCTWKQNKENNIDIYNKKKSTWKYIRRSKLLKIFKRLYLCRIGLKVHLK